MTPPEQDNPKHPRRPGEAPKEDVVYDLDAASGPDGGPDAEGERLARRLSELEAELEDAKSRALRTMADFQNYERRARQNEQVARQQGIQSVASSVAGVIDHFDIALSQDLSKATPQQIVDGIRVVRDELLKALASHGITLITPAPGEEFRPGRHEAVMQQPAQGVPAGHVVTTLQAGYLISDHLGERVLRPAKVIVAQ